MEYNGLIDWTPKYGMNFGGGGREPKDGLRGYAPSKAWGNFDWPWRRLWRKWKKGFSYL